jgi:glycosyltransferase involved in cell wall biosynthesis
MEGSHTAREGGALGRHRSRVGMPMLRTRTGTGTGAAGLRVVMVVANDVTRDSRVLREASVLATAGHHVTVLGIMTARTDAPEIEVRDGFVIRRLRYRARPPGWWVPPDFYARVRHQAARQYRLHRAKLRAVGRHARRLPKRRRFRLRSTRWQRLVARADALLRWRERRRMPVVLYDGRVLYPVPWPVASDRFSRRVTRWVRGAIEAIRLRLLQAAGTAARLAHRAGIQGGRVGRRLSRMRRRPIAILLRTLARVGAFLRSHVLELADYERALQMAAELRWRVVRPVVRGARAWLAIATLVLWGSVYLLANRTTGGALEWMTGWKWRWLGWADHVAEHAPDADVWHGHDMTSLPAIARLKAERGGVAVYDSHEVYLESGRHAGQPAWAKATLEKLERELVDGVDAVITVNQSLASILAERFGGRRVDVIYNCPPRTTGSLRGSPIRVRTGISRRTPLVLYHGSLAPHRGVEQLLAAIRLPALTGVHLAFLGFGPLAGWLREASQDSMYEHRVHVLDPVPPEELVGWLAGVDVAVAPIQASTMNHRFSSPNKVFEAIAAGTPVAGSDFPEFRRVILDPRFGPLGELFDPSRPEQIAAAIRRLLDLSPAERGSLRRRCRRAAAVRWNWQEESVHLVRMYDAFAGGQPSLPIASPASEVA